MVRPRRGRSRSRSRSRARRPPAVKLLITFEAHRCDYCRSLDLGLGGWASDGWYYCADCWDWWEWRLALESARRAIDPDDGP